MTEVERLREQIADKTKRMAALNDAYLQAVLRLHIQALQNRLRRLEAA